MLVSWSAAAACKPLLSITLHYITFWLCIFIT